MFKPGDKVTIHPADPTFSKWEGFEATVKHSSNISAWLEPLSSRPDGHGMHEFSWRASDLTERSIVSDFRGNAINVGDTVIYPGRRGSSLWLNEAVVEKVYELPYNRYNYQTRQSTTVMIPKLKVRRKNGGALVTLERLERVIKV